VAQPLVVKFDESIPDSGVPNIQKVTSKGLPEKTSDFIEEVLGF